MKESLSALMDSEIKVEELDALLLALKKEPALTASYLSWQTAAMGVNEVPVLSPEFHTRFAERLAAEPVVVIAPQPFIRPAGRQFMLWGGAAAALLVTVMTWYGLDGQVFSRVYGTAPPMMASNAGLHDYLAAHRSMLGRPVAQKDVRDVSVQTGQVRIR